MSAPTIAFQFANRNCCYVRGYHARDLIESHTGRAPLWSSIARAWVSTPWTAADLIGLAESRGWLVEITEHDPMPAALADVKAVRAEQRGELW